MNDEAIVVLGAAGFIGRHLVERIAASGRTVIAATRQPATFKHPGIENVTCAYTSSADFTPLLARSRSIVHAASASTPGSSVAQPQLDGNLRTTLALVEALQEFPDRKLLYLSSGGTLYGDSSHPVDERAPLRPRSYHAAGKIAAEFFIRAWATQYDGTAVILRPSNVYGPGQLPRDGFGIVPAAFEHVVQRRPLAIMGDGTAIRDFLYVDDLGELCTRVLEHAFPKGVHVLNAASGIGIELDAMLDAIDRATGQPLQRNYVPARRVDIPRILLDSSAAHTMFGWSAETTIDTGLDRTWQWFRTRL